jgi:hypothetical protein
LIASIGSFIDWCSPRPHVWISALVALVVIFNGFRRKAWPTLHDMGDLVISFAGLIGGCAVLRDAASKTEAEMKGLAWPIVIGGIATVWISARSAWDRMQKISPTPLPTPIPAAPGGTPPPPPAPAKGP